jgi:CspA family cold shock protein
MGRYKDFRREPRRTGFDGDSNSEERSFSDRPSFPPRNPAPERPRPSTSQVVGQTTESLGTVKMYKSDKGFGFVGQDNGGKDVFVHATALQRAGLTGLTQGQRVRMQIGQGKKGLEAQSIELLE